MATMTTIPGAAGGAVTGQKNIGVPVLGNKGGLNQFSPGGGSITGGPAMPTLPGGNQFAASTGTTPVVTKAPYVPPQTSVINRTPNPTALAQVPNAPVIQPIAASGTSPNNGNPQSTNPQQQQELQKQLVDIYGKGTGNALANLIGNLGSNDSSYLEAYKNAMAKTESEGLSTIGTSLGNAGISANSSTAAIEKADYMSGLDAQVGLQEQQLIARDQDLQASLIQGTQNDAKQEVGTSWLDTAGQVLGIAGNIAGDVATGGLSGIASSIGKSIFSGSNPGSVITPQASQLPGAITGGYGGSMPISIGQDPSLSELGF